MGVEGSWLRGVSFFCVGLLQLGLLVLLQVLLLVLLLIDLLLPLPQCLLPIRVPKRLIPEGILRG